MFLKGALSKLVQSKQRAYRTGQILPVVPARDLIGSGKHQAVIEQIKRIVDIPQEYFDALYETVLRSYAEMAQVLPAEMNGALSGLLNLGIARGTLALMKYRELYSGDSDSLYDYAIFTAGLASDVAKLLINQKIMIVDEEGNFIQEWMPFSGSLVDINAQYYKMYDRGPIYMRLQESITPLLARQILSKEGFNWIASDPAVLADWLATLRGDGSQVGRVTHVLGLIRDDEIAEFMQELAQLQLDVRNPVVTEYGEKFFEWLKEKIEAGEIVVNTTEAGVYMLEEGLFLDKQVFTNFVNAFNVSVRVQVVFQQFAKMMGYTALAGGEYMHDIYFSSFPEHMAQASKSLASPFASHQKSLREGMLLADPSMVFMNQQVPATTALLVAAKSKTPTQQNQTQIKHALPVKAIDNTVKILATKGPSIK